MNKIKLSLIGIAIFFSSLINAQSFQKGSAFLDLGFGFGFYATQAQINNIPYTYNDHAASWIVPLSFEYGIGNRIGIGAQLISDTYISGQDTTKANKNTAHGNEFALMGNYHFVRTNHIDFYGGITLGVSSLKVMINDYYDTQYFSGGSMVDIHFNTRFLFGNHFGIILSLRFPTLNYTNGTITNNLGNSVSFDFRGSGWVFGTGFTFKF